METRRENQRVILLSLRMSEAKDSVGDGQAQGRMLSLWVLLEGHRGEGPQVCLTLFQHLPPEVPELRTPHFALMNQKEICYCPDIWTKIPQEGILCVSENA